MKRALTQTQAAELLRAASALPPSSRDQFMSEVDRRLAGIRHRITDGDVNAAIISALAETPITTHVFCCDAAPKEPIMATNDDDDPFDERGILKDGRVARVSIQMRDAALVRDAMTRRGFDDSACFHRPGPVYCDRSAARQAYEDAKAEAQEAWKTPAANTVRGQQPGDLCTIDGAPGRLDDRLVCVPDTADRRRRHKMTTRDPQGRETGTAEWEEEEDSAPAVLPPRTMTADEARRIKQEAYDAMCAEDREAWRNP